MSVGHGCARAQAIFMDDAGGTIFHEHQNWAKNGKMQPDCGGHSGFLRTNRTPFESSRIIELNGTLSIRSVRVKVVKYLFNWIGRSYFENLLYCRKCTGLHGDATTVENDPPLFLGAL
jgi:hypothetical protein